MDHECKGAPVYCGTCGANNSRTQAHANILIEDIKRVSPDFKLVHAMKSLRTRYDYTLLECPQHIHAVLVN